MKRKNSVSILVFLLVLVGLGYLWFRSTITGGNSISVVVNPPLDIAKVEIQKGYYSINSKSDSLIIQQGLDDIIFYGSEKKTVKTRNGENDFLITYEQRYYTVFRHFIRNDFNNALAEPHRYNFFIESLHDTLWVTLDVEGYSHTRIKKPLVPIAVADKLLFGEKRK